MYTFYGVCLKEFLIKYNFNTNKDNQLYYPKR